jgi:hypothetical protein
MMPKWIFMALDWPLAHPVRLLTFLLDDAMAVLSHAAIGRDPPLTLALLCFLFFLSLFL